MARLGRALELRESGRWRHRRPRTRCDAVSIRERPAEAADRALPGHWEGDLIAGGKNTHVATLVERRSRFVMLVKVDGKDTKNVVDAIGRRVRTLPAQLRATLTWDRGKELAEHKRFTIATADLPAFVDS